MLTFKAFAAVAVAATYAWVPDAVTWLSPSVEPGSAKGKPTYNGSMPLGNGKITLLAWANVTAGGIGILAGQQDAMSDATDLFRTGLIHLKLLPNPFAGGSYFNQSLHLDTAELIVQAGGTDSSNPAVTITLFVDAQSDAFVVSVDSQQPVSMTVQTSSTRPSTNWTYDVAHFCLPGFSRPDVHVDPLPSGLSFQPGSVIQYHRNNDTADESVIASTLVQQSLTPAVSAVPDHWTSRQFGYVIDGGDGPALSRVGPATLQSTAPSTSFQVRVVTLSAQTDGPQDWLQQLSNAVQVQNGVPYQQRKAAHEAWWRSFWNTSYIVVNGTSLPWDNSNAAFNVTSQYAITRYMHAIQSRGHIWPIKFNGMAFSNVMGSNGEAEERDWGPANWWQNMRLPYWTMLGTGDIEHLIVVLEYYMNQLPFALAKTQTWFNFSGAFHSETETLFGSYGPWDYAGAHAKSCTRNTSWPVWLQQDDYIKLDFSGDGATLEPSFMALELYYYTGNATALERYLPLATAGVDFLRQFYTNRTADGKYVIWPTQALETFQCPGWDTVNNRPGPACVVNDMPTVAALHAVLGRLLQLPPQFSTPQQRAEWQDFYSALPLLPTNNSALAPASLITSGRGNVETPELYAVHPYRLLSVGRNVTQGGDLDPGVAAFFANKYANESNSGWNQGIMNAALLGLPGPASAFLVDRAATSPSPGYRFPGFMPAMQDAAPSADHLANMMSGLQLMLLQPGEDGFGTANGTVVLFPSWPCSWDVSFKLWAPGNTTVEVQYVGGSLLNIDVQPAERRNAVTFARCVQA